MKQPDYSSKLYMTVKLQFYISVGTVYNGTKTSKHFSYGHLASTVHKGSKIAHTHTYARGKKSEGMYSRGVYHIYNTTNILIHTLISTSSTVGGTEPLEIHSAVIRANLIRSNSEKPLMNIKTFFISSSNIFSRYLYRRISLMNTYNITYTI